MVQVAEPLTQNLNPLQRPFVLWVLLRYVCLFSHPGYELEQYSQVRYSLSPNLNIPGNIPGDIMLFFSFLFFQISMPFFEEIHQIWCHICNCDASQVVNITICLLVWKVCLSRSQTTGILTFPLMYQSPESSSC